MARKFKTVAIDAEGRDKGKSFLIVEKSAYDAEKWATRALLALSRAGAEVPDDALSAGSLGLVLVGLDALRKLPYEEAEPLLEEMLGCVHFVPDVTKTDPMSGRPVTRGLMLPDEFNDGDVEEVATLLKLREEAVGLHLGFSLAAVLQTMAATLTSRQQSSSMSPVSSEQSLEADAQA